ncbi:MAG TPA: hypothetical protein VMJ49_02345 [Gaiellaceae bacterium]|nr:hypothetical protein [Gaiellaceae bacterium]
MYANGRCSAAKRSSQRAPSTSPVASVSVSRPGPISTGQPSCGVCSASSGKLAFRARGAAPVQSASQSAASPSSSASSLGTRIE